MGANSRIGLTYLISHPPIIHIIYLYFIASVSTYFDIYIYTSVSFFFCNNICVDTY